MTPATDPRRQSGRSLQSLATPVSGSTDRAGNFGLPAFMQTGEVPRKATAFNKTLHSLKPDSIRGQLAGAVLGQGGSQSYMSPMAERMYRQRFPQGNPVPHANQSFSNTDGVPHVQTAPGDNQAIRSAGFWGIANHESEHAYNQPPAMPRDYHEIGPVLGDVVFAAEQFQRETGRPLGHEVRFPGVSHDANWMNQMATQHGYWQGRPIGDLLYNTPEGRQWLKRAHGTHPVSRPPTPAPTQPSAPLQPASLASATAPRPQDSDSLARVPAIPSLSIPSTQMVSTMPQPTSARPTSPTVATTGQRTQLRQPLGRAPVGGNPEQSRSLLGLAPPPSANPNEQSQSMQMIGSPTIANTTRPRVGQPLAGDPATPASPYTVGAGNFADSLAANPMQRGRSLSQLGLAPPVQPSPASMAEFNYATQQAANINNQMQRAQNAGMRMASPMGYTDQYNVTTRNGVSTPGPSMGNQAAIDAAYAARPVGPMPRFGQVEVGGFVPRGEQPQMRSVDGSRTLDEIFPSGQDAENRAKFEAHRDRNDEQRAMARNMRMQRAQFQNATGWQNKPGQIGSPMFDEQGQADLLATMAAQQMMQNPRASLAAMDSQRERLQGDRRLDQMGEQLDLQRSAQEYTQGETAFERQRELAGLGGNATFTPSDAMRTRIETQRQIAENPALRETYISALPITDDPSILTEHMNVAGLTVNDLQQELLKLDNPGLFGSLGEAFSSDADRAMKDQRKQTIRQQLQVLGAPPLQAATRPRTGAYEGFSSGDMIGMQ